MNNRASQILLDNQSKHNGLSLLENEENRVIALRKAINEGLESGRARDFDPKKHLASLKDKRRANS